MVRVLGLLIRWARLYGRGLSATLAAIGIGREIAVATPQFALPLSDVVPGSESVRLVPNGGFEQYGEATAGVDTVPTGWSRQSRMVVGPAIGPNTGGWNRAAAANLAEGTPIGAYRQTLELLPDTEYVLSAWVWNFGNPAHSVAAVLDLNDVPDEPQLVVWATDPFAESGYFVHRSFNTARTGTTVQLRVFYDHLAGTGAAPAYHPIAAQWDNIAITPATMFAPPRAKHPDSPRDLRLQLSYRAGRSSLTWNSTNPALRLEATRDLRSPVVWETITSRATLQSSGAGFGVTNGGPQAYYRLRDAEFSALTQGKILAGYQGWFACPGDGSQLNSWFHWFRSQVPAATNATFDLWPDLSGLEPDELFPTRMQMPAGGPAMLYSAYHPETVARHFRWMRDYGIDGVVLNRFATVLGNPTMRAFFDRVVSNVRDGAEAAGRSFALMYDISGQDEASLVGTLTNDWARLGKLYDLAGSPAYLRHDGKPLVAIWGLGFEGRPGTPQQARQLIDHFHGLGLAVMGGVPTYWRELRADAKSDPAWREVYAAFDILSPWSVGRYGDNAGADAFKVSLIAPDLTATRAAGVEYMPVIFPGFSWRNLLAGPLNQIPRRGGRFYWRQGYNAIAAGCSTIFVAMFDEVDEGTAIYKLTPRKVDLPTSGEFLSLDADGELLPSDWYLRLTGELTKMLRGTMPLSAEIPIRP